MIAQSGCPEAKDSGLGTKIAAGVQTSGRHNAPLFVAARHPMPHDYRPDHGTVSRNRRTEHGAVGGAKRAPIAAKGVRMRRRECAETILKRDRRRTDDDSGL